MTPPRLTGNARRLYDAWCALDAGGNTQPSYQELQDAARISSLSVVAYWVAKFADRGIVTREHHGAQRAYRIVRPTHDDPITQAARTLIRTARCTTVSTVAVERSAFESLANELGENTR